jgi:hypothetical protein
MLRTRVRRAIGPTGVAVQITHGLGTTLDMWWWVACSARGRGATYRPVATFPTATVITLVNSIQTNVTLDVFCLVFQGRLY